MAIGHGKDHQKQDEGADELIPEAVEVAHVVERVAREERGCTWDCSYAGTFDEINGVEIVCIYYTSTDNPS